ncbi:hypothetical protein GCM10010172_47960 [Paractinoplanes ferrugineus]|uniref:Uncharacterized protein n=1 Tax=Paractinoplanes ferrugineus TaxID=113564 RepID=A0A919MKD1_9ACTN|nr:hypothetical protein [Actinoplanes ferrugineus]GIE11057.1 hypothetical protein Afe05nite_28970 [Actinoplanes ferrugineus]
MATCNLCPPDNREVADDEMADHLRTVHPEVEPDGTGRTDDSTIVRDASLEPTAGQQWRPPTES